MGKESNIEWTDSSWNPWHGCKKVSQGCKNCYMFRDKKRFNQDPTKIQRSKTTFDAPLKWRDPKRIFTCSWSDFFIEEADTWRDEAWDVMFSAPRHVYQILTKRPERIKDNLPNQFYSFCSNIFLGVTVESTEDVWRIAELRKIPYVKKFVSFEPLLERITLTSSELDGIDWAIIGGESGNGARPCRLSWIDELTLWCSYADIPVFVKQLGSFKAKLLNLEDKKGSDFSDLKKSLVLPRREFPQILRR